MVRQIIKINSFTVRSCSECGHSRIANVNGIYLYGCLKLRKMVQGNTIDDNCPLPDLDTGEKIEYEEIVEILEGKLTE